ncbi:MULTISPECIES: phage protein NinX family protein [Pseudomonas]|uniref:phage protein NinX family protein n=1 Tax=Pseudomonas TaxID=286 RepID=UPI000B3566EC|nr:MULTISPECIES: phage protein NinX family protein [Pseudomonas]PMY71011.1 DUF2591 domain-containing protein [Pseudomonas sp. FW305-25]PMY75540.1 DUF2591 domain-containing protein [Pseudomonas sp. FW126-L8]PNA81438.1 DUF2591 domain-containing protein [Pseudomonas sp. FW305-76]
MNDMIEVKTADLIGPALDWAVAKAEGMRQHTPDGLKHAYWYSGDRCIGTHWQPSTSWGQGGPLIEKYMPEFEVNHFNSMVWAFVQGSDLKSRGESHLIAACRAIVAAKLGNTVSVPEELAKQ